MKLKKVLVVMLACMIALSSLVSFVGCSNEITEEVGNASVSFATSVSKALNQDGSTNTGVTQEVGNFYWKYYCSTTAPTLTNDTWTAFFDTDTKGLGKIEGLIKGENYYFGLRGYSDKGFGDNTLVWEGFHYSDATTKTLESVKLTSKTQLITVDVFTAGIGRLFFNFTAPAVNGFCITGDNAAHFKDGETVKYDYFSYTLSDLTGQILSTATDLVIDGTKSDDNDTIYYDATEDTFYYANSTGRELDAGTYLMTIWQNSWNCDADGGAKYQQVSQRKQVLIINIVPGVDTIVSGSLDSTALDVIDYEANGYTEENQKHMQVIFHAANTSKVVPLSVTSKTPSGGTAIVNDNDRIEVYNGQYVEFSWTSDTNVRIYVNGDELDLDPETTDSRDDFGTGSTIAFYTRKTNNTTLYNYVAYLAEGTKDSVRAYGKAGLDYIVTIETVATDQQNNQSMSFTIVGKAAKVTSNSATFKTANLEASTEEKLNETVSISTEVTTTTGMTIVNDGDIKIKNSEAIEIAKDLLEANNDSDYTYLGTGYNKELKLVLAVEETEKTAASTSFEISLEATMSSENASNNTDSFATTTPYSVKTLNEYITTSMSVPKGLPSVVVTHSDITMIECTSSEELTDAGTSEADAKADTYNTEKTMYVGFYYYDSENGLLYIKTRSFSPFEIVYPQCEARIGDTYYGTFAVAYNNAQAGETITLLKDLTTTEAIVINKAITIDGDGFKITDNSTLVYDVGGSNITDIIRVTGLASGSVGIKNITLFTSNKQYTGIRVANINSGNTASDFTLNIDNVLIDVRNDSCGGYPVMLQTNVNGINVNINDLTTYGWGAIQSTCNDIKLTANDSKFVTVNKLKDASNWNCYTAIVVSNYYDNGSGDSSNNEFVFNNCEFSAEREYENTQDILGIRSPYNNVAKFNNCEFTYEDPYYMNVCFASNYGGSNRSAESKDGTSKVYIDGVDVTYTNEHIYNSMDVNAAAHCYMEYGADPIAMIEDEFGFMEKDAVVDNNSLLWTDDDVTYALVKTTLGSMNFWDFGPVSVKVTINGANKYYSTFESAVTAAQNKSATITLLEDVDLTSYTGSQYAYTYIINLTDDVLDLNGHSITSSHEYDYPAVCYIGSNIVVKNGTFNLQNGSEASYGLYLGNGGGTGATNVTLEKITVNSGINCYMSSVTMNNVTSNGTNYYSVWAETYSTVIINSGSYSSPSTKGKAVLSASSSTDASIIVKGGTFTANRSDVAIANGNVLITGGTFNEDPSDFVQPGFEAVESGDAWIVQATENVNNEGKIISGTYTKDPSVYVAEGYVAEANDLSNPTSWTVGEIQYKVVVSSKIYSTDNIKSADVTDDTKGDYYINPGIFFGSSYKTDPEWICLTDDSVSISCFDKTAAGAWASNYIIPSGWIEAGAMAKLITSDVTTYFATEAAASAFATAHSTTYTTVE